MLERLRDVTAPLLLLLVVLLGSSLVAAEADLAPRIVGGVEAAPGEFPHQIFLLWNVTFFLGGGSILTRDWVLTCGHCLQFAASEITVVSGTNSLTSGGSRHASEIIIPHDGFFMQPPFPHDIGLIKVSPPFTLDGVLEAAVKLPAPGLQIPADTPATAIGWGMMWQSGDIPDKMRKVDILVRDHDLCKAAYEPYYNVTISDQQVCADGPEGGMSVCKGDSGGPLLVNGEVVGITSWEYGCAVKGFPAIYTNVATYIDWINDNMAKHR